MTKLIRIAALLIVTIAGGKATGGQPRSVTRARVPVPNQYIVTFTEDQLSRARVRNAADALGRAYGAKVVHVYDHVLGGMAVQMTAAAAERMLSDARVHEIAEDAQPPRPAAFQYTPLPQGLDRIDQSSLPLSGFYQYVYSGSLATIYVIDTGVNYHSEFQGRLIGARNFWTNRGTLFDPSRTDDCYGHGTYVAAVAAGATSGVAKGANLFSVKAFGCSTSDSSVSDYIAAVNWVATEKRANPSRLMVVTYALPAFPNSQLDAAAIDLVAAGVTVVVAAGNDNGQDACNWSPARMGNPNNVPSNVYGYSVITVGASDPLTDSVSNFSNIGSCVDLFAPGENTDALDTGVAGTSFAAPLVAGSATLRLESEPTLLPQGVEDRIKGNATPDVLSNTGNGSPNLLLYTLSRRRRACCS